MLRMRDGSLAKQTFDELLYLQHARLGLTAFLIPYPTGYELWAPWSDELGRWPIMQASLSLTNISILVCALATNFKTVIGGRVMGGMSSAGGFVTMGMVADMFPAEEQHFAVLWASLFSCLGSVIGSICGGPIQQYLPSWRWNFWIQLMLGCATQLSHLFLAKEMRSTILLGREVKKQRKFGAQNGFGRNEVKT
jgi:MFS family permease